MYLTDRLDPMAEAHTSSHEPSSQDESLTALNEKLDSLWVQYLALLDQYQKAQADLQRCLSTVRLLHRMYQDLVADRIFRVSLHLPKPTSSLQIADATARTTTTIA